MFEYVILDPFIILIEFGLVIVDTISILRQHEYDMWTCAPMSTYHSPPTDSRHLILKISITNFQTQLKSFQIFGYFRKGINTKDLSLRKTLKFNLTTLKTLKKKKKKLTQNKTVLHQIEPKHPKPKIYRSKPLDHPL